MSAAEDRLLSDVPWQLRDHIAGACLSLGLLGAGGGDFRQAAWEFIADVPFSRAAYGSEVALVSR